MHTHRFATLHLMHAAFLAGFFVLLIGGIAGPARAQPLADIFAVQRIPVDVTAATAGEARAQALIDGQRRAFRLLLERLTLKGDAPRLPALSEGDLELYVRDFGVADEKTSAVRYIATMNVRFRPQPVRDLLGELGIQFAETPSKPVVILPVYEVGGSVLLWDDPNPWALAWNARAQTYGLVPMVMPLGDLGDIAAIGPAQAVDGDSQGLSALARRYGASDTVVAQAVLGIDVATSRSTLEVFVTRFGTDLVEQTVARSYAAEEGESGQTLLNRAAMDIAALVEDTWKLDNLLNFGEQSVLAVTVPLRGLHDWLTIKARLIEVAVVRRTDLILLSRGEARVNVQFIGDVDQLALALEQADLALREEPDGGGWFLYQAVRN